MGLRLIVTVSNIVVLVFTEKPHRKLDMNIRDANNGFKRYKEF